MLNQVIKKKEGDNLSRQANANFTERNKGVYQIVKVATVATHLITGILSVASLHRFLAADFGNFYLLIAVIVSVLMVLELLQNAGLNAFFRNSLSPLHDAEDDYSNSLVRIGLFIGIMVTGINIILPTASGYFAVTGEKISIANKLQRIKTDSPSPTLDLSTVKSKYKGLAAANQASAQKAAAETQASIVAAVTAEHTAEAQAANFAQNIAAFSLLFLAILMEFAKWGGTKLKWTYIFRAAAENNKTTPPLFTKKTAEKETATETNNPHEATKTSNPIGFFGKKPVATEKTDDYEEFIKRMKEERDKQEARQPPPPEPIKMDKTLILDGIRGTNSNLNAWRSKLKKGEGDPENAKKHITMLEKRLAEWDALLETIKEKATNL